MSRGLGAFPLAQLSLVSYVVRLVTFVRRVSGATNPVTSVQLAKTGCQRPVAVLAAVAAAHSMTTAAMKR